MLSVIPRFNLHRLVDKHTVDAMQCKAIVSRMASLSSLKTLQP